MEYIRRSGAPDCIFPNKHKTLFNLFSPDPAVSCVGSHPEMYALCSILVHFVYESIISFFHMGQMDFISSTFVRLFFSKII